MYAPGLLIFKQNLYESIKNEPFKIPEDDGNDLTHTFFNPDREGWLLKLGKSARDVQMPNCALLPLSVIIPHRSCFVFFFFFYG